MLVCYLLFPKILILDIANQCNLSLEKDPTRRASPWRMLEHPWMTEMRGKRVNMPHFLSEVWGWGKEGK